MNGFILDYPSCWSTCLPSCQFHVVWVTIIPPFALKSGDAMSPVLFFFVQDYLDHFGSFLSPLAFRGIYFSTSVRNTIIFGRGLHSGF